MKNLIKSLLILSIALSPWVAQAKIFMCKDASGRTITSDRPIPECADRDVKELDRSGVVRREIARPPTPEEKRQQKADEEKRKADAAVADEKKKSDQLLLVRFSSEKDIGIARMRALNLARDQLKMESIALVAAEKKLADATGEVDAAKNRPRGVPADFLRRAGEAEQAVKDGKKAIQEREATIKQIDVTYDEILRRYREITGAAGIKTDAPPAAKTQ